MTQNKMSLHILKVSKKRRKSLQGTETGRLWENGREWQLFLSASHKLEIILNETGWNATTFLPAPYIHFAYCYCLTLLYTNTCDPLPIKQIFIWCPSSHIFSYLYRLKEKYTFTNTHHSLSLFIWKMHKNLKLGSENSFSRSSLIPTSLFKCDVLLIAC